MRLMILFTQYVVVILVNMANIVRESVKKLLFFLLFPKLWVGVGQKS